MPPRGPRAVAIAALLAAAVIGGACGAARPAARAGAPSPTVPGAAHVPSNILRADYAGSARCAGCHADVVAAWRGAPMHLMTRVPEGARVRAPFDGTIFRFKDDTATMTEKEGVRFVTLSSSAGGQHLYRVTRVIGGRYREDFAGIEVGEAGGLEDGRGDRELILPISYVFETRSFRLKGYSVLVGERPGLHAGGVWNQTCIFCHNTVPYFDDVWGALYGRGAPGYQGEVVDKLLPPERRFRFEVSGDDQGLVEAVAAEVTAVGGTPTPGEGRQAALKHGIHELRGRFTARKLVEVGIGCEACHGGSRAHADDPRLLPDFAPRSAFLAARPEVPRPDGEVTRAEWINRTCARCHQVLFSRYPFTWEGGQRRGAEQSTDAGTQGGSPHPPATDSAGPSPAPSTRPAGGSSITSGEGRDFLLGGCARQMSCVTCHDPHGEDRRADLERLGTPAGNGVCVRCHAQFAAPAALRAHAHHDPNGAGGSCIACHMPRKNMGLGYALTRYHRIGLPDDPARVERDRPLECALCHADKTVGDLVGTMERWWGRKYDRAALETLYGDLTARPLEATLARGKAHEQAVALATLGAAHATEAVPGVARQLVNPFPLVRYYAKKALAALRGEDCAVDLDRPTAEIAAAVRACVPAAFVDGAVVPFGTAGHDRDVPDED